MKTLKAMSLAVLAAATFNSASAQTKTFLEVCNDNTLPPDQAQTVKAVLENVGFKMGLRDPMLRTKAVACEDADKKIKAEKKLVLRDNSFTFFPQVTTVGSLEPLSTLQGLESIEIELKSKTGNPFQPSVIQDVSPLTKIKSLKKVVLRAIVSQPSLLEQLPNLEELHLQNGPGRTFGNFKKLKSLNLSIRSNHELRGLSDAPVLTDLSLNVHSRQGRFSLPGQSMDLREITAIRTLEKLDIVASVPIEGLFGLPHLTSLKSMNVEANQTVDINFFGMDALEELSIRGGEHKSLDSISGAVNLKTLILEQVGLKKVEMIRMLTKLEKLDLSHNSINDMKPVKDLQNLREINLQENSVSVLGPIGNIKRLQKLNLSGNGVLSVGWIAGLTNLVELDLGRNQLRDVQALSSMTKLRKLELSVNRIFTIEPLRNLKELESLGIQSNRLSEVRVLAELPKLHKATDLNLDHNKLVSLEGLENFTSLETLSAWDNSILDVTPIQGLTQIRRLSLSHNQIEDLSPLAGFVNTTYFGLDENPVQDRSVLDHLKKVGVTIHL